MQYNPLTGGYSLGGGSGSLTTVARHTEIFDASEIIGDTITLFYSPIADSIEVHSNGISMTLGSDYDYTIVNGDVIFNDDVAPSRGFVKVKYEY